MSITEELKYALGEMALKLIKVESELEKTAADRDFWREQWDKLRNGEIPSVAKTKCDPNLPKASR